MDAPVSVYRKRVTLDENASFGGGNALEVISASAYDELIWQERTR